MVLPPIPRSAGVGPLTTDVAHGGAVFRVRAARELPFERLLPLAERIRAELRARGEPVSPEWPGGVTKELREGTLDGWVLASEHGEVGLAIFAEKGDRAYGHLHLESTAADFAAVRELLEYALGNLPSSSLRADFGVTGLIEEEERELAASLRPERGYSFLEREGLARSLEIASPPISSPLPPGYRFGDLQRISTEVLDQIDRKAFAAGIDESLLSSTPEGNRRVLAGIRAGELGRFLPAASFAVLDSADRAVGFLMTVEESARSAVFADLAVEPEHRGRGIGKALLSRGLRALLALGYGTARLWVTIGNVPARGLYAQLGFRGERRAFLYRWARPAASPQMAR